MKKNKLLMLLALLALVLLGGYFYLWSQGESKIEKALEDYKTVTKVMGIEVEYTPHKVHSSLGSVSATMPSLEGKFVGVMEMMGVKGNVSVSDVTFSVPLVGAKELTVSAKKGERNTVGEGNKSVENHITYEDVLEKWVYREGKLEPKFIAMNNNNWEMLFMGHKIKCDIKRVESSNKSESLKGGNHRLTQDITFREAELQVGGMIFNLDNVSGNFVLEGPFSSSYTDFTKSMADHMQTFKKEVSVACQKEEPYMPLVGGYIKKLIEADAKLSFDLSLERKGVVVELMASVFFKESLPEVDLEIRIKGLGKLLGHVEKLVGPDKANFSFVSFIFKEDGDYKRMKLGLHDRNYTLNGETIVKSVIPEKIDYDKLKLEGAFCLAMMQQRAF